jgi:hypothetical protein
VAGKSYSGIAGAQPMTDRHTPGPWTVSKEGYIGAGEYGTNPVVAKVARFAGPGDHERFEADRRLIAAAPDLLRAVQCIVDTYGDTDDMSIVRCKAALAKARGKV